MPDEVVSSKYSHYPPPPPGSLLLSLTTIFRHTHAFQQHFPLLSVYSRLPCTAAGIKQVCVCVCVCVRVWLYRYFRLTFQDANRGVRCLSAVIFRVFTYSSNIVNIIGPYIFCFSHGTFG